MNHAAPESYLGGQLLWLSCHSSIPFQTETARSANILETKVQNSIVSSAVVRNKLPASLSRSSCRACDSCESHYSHICAHNINVIHPPKYLNQSSSRIGQKKQYMVAHTGDAGRTEAYSSPDNTNSNKLLKTRWAHPHSTLSVMAYTAHVLQDPSRGPDLLDDHNSVEVGSNP